MSLWGLSTKTILIIDDFAQMRAMIAGMLKNFAPKEVHQASNAQEAIALIAKHRFDVIFCDYNLGDAQDGQQILEEAKQKGILPYYTVFIMVTAENTNDMVMGAVEYQPDAYLTKPVNKEVVVARLRKLFDKKEELYSLSVALGKNDPLKVVQCCENLLVKNVRSKMEVLKIKCEQLLKLKRYDEIKAICQSILAEREIPWAKLLLGKVLFFEQNYEDAYLQFQEIIECDKRFMPAYDWLAKILELRGELEKAQGILMEAVNMSSKSILRQRHLAAIAEKNNDEAVLEKALKQAAFIGKTSYLKEYSDFSRFAKMQLDKNAPQRAMELLNDSKKLFRGDPKVELEHAVDTAVVHKVMGNKSKYELGVASALKLAASDPALLKGNAALTLARSCLDLGQKEQAQEILKNVAQENVENPDFFEKIKDVYNDFGLEDEAASLLASAKADAKQLNSEGVNLITKGDIDGALELFESALCKMPESVSFNLNAARCLVFKMKQSGFDPKILEKIDLHVESILRNDPGNKEVDKINDQCRELSK